MNKLKLSVGTLAIGLFLMAMPAKAYIIPIASLTENRQPNWRLLIESELTRWKQDALKQKEIIYTETLGKRGTGDDGTGKLAKVPGIAASHSEIITQMQEGAEQGANIIEKSSTNVTTSDFSGIDASTGRDYTDTELSETFEKHRTALNTVATYAIAMGATETVNAAIRSAESAPKKRTEQFAKAKELGEMYELMLGQDRKIYERSLHAAALEATAGGLEAARILQSIAVASVGLEK